MVEDGNGWVEASEEWVQGLVRDGIRLGCQPTIAKPAEYVLHMAACHMRPASLTRIHLLGLEKMTCLPLRHTAPSDDPAEAASAIRRNSQASAM
jgi:hypothetical protein